MRSMSFIISAHKCPVLSPLKTSFGCNCQNRIMCPLQNKCFTPNIVYQADIASNADDERRVYLGLSETPLKTDIVIVLGILTMRYTTTRMNFLNMCGI